MKLLFDQNLSCFLPRILAEGFPGSRHVRDFELQAADDRAIWSLARKDDFTIVTKDDDFVQLSAVLGGPPKVMHLRIGNVPTAAIAGLLTLNQHHIQAWANEPEQHVLVLMRS